MRNHCLRYIVALFAAFFMLSCGVTNSVRQRKDVSPILFGLKEARTGVERYDVLLRTHQAAVAKGVNVDYSGIKRIDIEIPRGAKAIPLTQMNDFKGCTIYVRNTCKNGWLFTATAKSEEIEVSAKAIDGGDFRSYPQLRRGKYLLIIEDKNPWVENRRGYSYGHQRQDILLIEKGHAKNTVIMPYNNADSNPKCKYIVANSHSIEVKNLTIERDVASTAITMICGISGYDDVCFTNITVNTPESELNGDRVLRITNSTNVTLTDVRINGTYSQKGKYGYGISLDNVWNFKAKRLYGNGNWGLFGNNNVNTALIEDSEINRFDIHCYGRDVTFKSVKFFDLYNQFSSVFGRVTFEQCEFRNFTPVLIETSYNAYTEFEVDFTDCMFYITPAKNYLVNTGSLTGEENARRELMEKKLPRVNVENMKVFSLETGEEVPQVDVFLKKGKFIQERQIQNVIKLK